MNKFPQILRKSAIQAKIGHTNELHVGIPHEICSAWFFVSGRW